MAKKPTKQPETLKQLCERVLIRSAPCERTDGIVGWAPGSSHYKCHLTYNGRTCTVQFSMGPALCKEPTAFDVLSCLISDASGCLDSFESWCGDYGYDVDSRKAERIWKACIKSAAKTRRLLGADFDRFAQAE